MFDVEAFLIIADRSINRGATTLQKAFGTAKVDCLKYSYPVLKINNRNDNFRQKYITRSARKDVKAQPSVVITDRGRNHATRLDTINNSEGISLPKKGPLELFTPDRKITQVCRRQSALPKPVEEKKERRPSLEAESTATTRRVATRSQTALTKNLPYSLH